MRADVRGTVRSVIIEAIINAPSSIQVHLGEIISTIAMYDFPAQWETLLPSLVSKLSSSNYNVNNGVLLAANSIFKRYVDDLVILA